MNGSVVWSQAKVVICGAENVGKTHLTRRLQQREYKQNISTNGISIETVTTGPVKGSSGRSFTFNVFDFGGTTLAAQHKKRTMET